MGVKVGCIVGEFVGEFVGLLVGDEVNGVSSEMDLPEAQASHDFLHLSFTATPSCTSLQNSLRSSLFLIHLQVLLMPYPIENA